MAGGLSGLGGNGGVDPDFFNWSLEVINQKLEEKKPAELIEIFLRALEHLNEGKSKQVALLVLEKLNHEVKPSMDDDLCQRIIEVSKQFLDTSLIKFHNNSLEEDEAKLVGSILKGEPVAYPLFLSLYKAAQFKRADVFDHLLKAAAGTNITDGKHEHLLLMKAVKEGDKEVVKFLLEYGVDVNKFGDDPPLCLAASKGNKEVAELLLEHGAQVDMADTYGVTPLLAAAYSGQKEMVGLLLEHNADINKADNHTTTPLLHAIQCGQKEIVELLLQRVVDINNADNRGVTLLHSAISYGHIKIAELLLERGADINKVNNNGDTPLYLAVRDGKKEIAELLLERGANPHETIDEAGTTLRDLAIELKNPAMIELLLRYG